MFENQRKKISVQRGSLFGCKKRNKTQLIASVDGENCFIFVFHRKNLLPEYFVIDNFSFTFYI